MRARSGIGLPASLRRARDQFERWRDGHEVGTRIPEKLWRLAAELAVTYGVSRTASTLKLDYYSLKRRLPAQASPEVPSLASTRPAFLELPPSAFPTPTECIIDLEHSSGAKMRIHCKGVAPDLVTLSRAFWMED